MLKIIYLLGFIILVMSADLSFGTEPVKKSDESAQKEVDREIRFLYRAIDELEQLISYLNEDINGLEKQINAIVPFGPQRSEDDLREMADLYEDYQDRLKGYAAEFQDDLNGYFTGETGLGWMNRYNEMEKDYSVLEGQLKEKVKNFENERAKFEFELSRMGRKLLNLEKLKQIENKLDEKKEKQIIEDKVKEEKETGQIDAQILALLDSIRRLKELVKHFDVLIQKGHDELDWISMKIGDCAMLNKSVLGRGSKDIFRLEPLYKEVIENYESDITRLQRKLDKIDIKRSNNPRTGTHKELDLDKALLEHLDNLRSRYEKHINWLKVQIGSYEADLTELRLSRTH